MAPLDLYIELMALLDLIIELLVPNGYHYTSSIGLYDATRFRVMQRALCHMVYLVYAWFPIRPRHVNCNVND